MESCLWILPRLSVSIRAPARICLVFVALHIGHVWVSQSPNQGAPIRSDVASEGICQKGREG